MAGEGEGEMYGKRGLEGRRGGEAGSREEQDGKGGECMVKKKRIGCTWGAVLMGEREREGGNTDKEREKDVTRKGGDCR